MKHPLSCFCGRKTFAPPLLPPPLPEEEEEEEGLSLEGERQREEDRLFIKAVNPMTEKSMGISRIERLVGSKWV